MAFQTNVFRGGEWVTETINLQAVLKAGSSSQGQKKQRLLKPPQCGILTRTVVESHLVNSILPVRLRSPRHNDVAFIGDHDIRIRELQGDGQLKEVARKSDFGSRIRNACVIGSFDIREADEEGLDPLSVKTEDGESAPFSFMPSSSSAAPARQLPPQLLMVVLECGDCIFLYLRHGSGGDLVFETARAPPPGNRIVQPGFHLAIDPSSRYMVLGCAQDLFVVYELESLDVLNQQYIRNERLVPVRVQRPRSVQGVIHKVHFLYPRPEDQHHVILLLIIVRNNKSRMVTYEWELGDDLRRVFSEEKHGHRMPVANQMPVLIIPLTVRSAFIAISQEQVAVCTAGLYGPPNFETMEMENPRPTRNYHGRQRPLWTAWARPFRLSPYFERRDCLYLAREDGEVIFIEADSESALDRSTFMDKFDSNISGAFTCLFDQYTDVLVLGSESGPGAVWKVPARQPLELLGTLPNWAPAVDFVTTDELSTWKPEANGSGNQTSLWQSPSLRKPDRVFATSGHSLKGSITEYRYGLRASIGLDLDYGTEVKEAWLLPSRDSSQEGGFNLLLSMPDCTALLYLPEDLSEAQETNSDALVFDLSAPTLAMASSGNFLTQVTKASIVLLGPGKSARFSYRDVLQTKEDFVVSDACIMDEHVAISTHTNTQYHIHVFKIEKDLIALSEHRVIEVDGDVTCLSLGAGQTVLAGIWKNGRAFIGRSFLHTAVDEGALYSLELADIGNAMTNGEVSPIEAISSIVSAWGSIIIGTRSGEVIKITDSKIECEKFGITTARISCGYNSDSERPAVLITCDGSLILLRDRDAGNPLSDSIRSKDRLRVWPVDASNLAAVAPSVDYAAVAGLPSNSPDTSHILMISGTKLLLAEVQHHPGPVHRHLPLGGTPMKVIYSQHLQCLIVAVFKEDKPTLMFVDPDSGEDLGKPEDKKTNKPVDFISGLGKPGDRIYGLAEWEFKKEGKTWNFLLVSTRGGRLIVVSTKKGEPRGDKAPLIRYWMQFQKKGFDRPVYSVTGYEEGLIFCVGQSIHWDVLDAAEKKLRNIKTHELGSPATSLRVINGKLVVLTSQDSLEVIDYSRELTEQSHVDPKKRNAIHMIEVAGTQPEDALGNITLVADRDCGVTGLWIPWQVPGRDCEVVLEAELQTSIRRFRRGRTRPIWEQAQRIPKFGRLPSTVDDAEILGISLDGSMQHFTLLSLDAWRLLRFIQNVALTNEELYPFTYDQVDDYADFDPEPQLVKGLEMHVDGDMLQRCLEKRALQRLLSWPEHEVRFAELLTALDGGKHTAGMTLSGGREKFFELAYDIIEYYLRPVL